MFELNKIYNEDCLEFMKRVPDKYFDLVLTDPPFGMSFQSGYRNEQHKKIANIFYGNANVNVAIQY